MSASPEAGFIAFTVITGVLIAVFGTFVIPSI